MSLLVPPHDIRAGYTVDLTGCLRFRTWAKGPLLQKSRKVHRLNVGHVGDIEGAGAQNIARGF